MSAVTLSNKQINIVAWGLSLAVSIVAVAAWGQGLRWHFAHLSSYKLFPIFGLIAFSLMWVHYIVAAIKKHHHAGADITKNYFAVTSFIVLIAIALHPGLLIWQLWRDGFGLPPSSYIHNYVSPKYEWAALLGTVSWFTFLGFELHRWFSKKSWWRFVNYACDAAMIAILIHSLRLGTNLQHGWLRVVWLFYGITYLAALAYIRLAKQSVA